MKNAAQIMYKIAKIFNIIAIPVSALILIIGIVVTATTPVSNNMTPEELATLASATTCIMWGIYLLITSILSIIICPKKQKEIENGSNEVAPRVFLIVFGAIAQNAFYILSGIFSLVARSQEANSSNSNSDSNTESNTDTNE